MNKIFFLIVFILFMMVPPEYSYAQNQTNLNIVDGNGSRQTVCEYVSGLGNLIGCNTPLFFNGNGFGAQPADGSYRPYVNIYSMPPVSGDTGHYSYQVGQTVTTQTTSYTAGMSEGGLLKIQVVRLLGGSGTLTGFKIRSNAGSTNTIWVYAYSKLPTSGCADQSTFTPSAADAIYALPGFPMSATLGGSAGSWDMSTVIQKTGLNTQYQNQDVGGGTNYIYLCLVTGSSITPPSSTDLSIVVTAQSD